MTMSLAYYNEVLGKGAPRRLTLIHEITGAVTVAARPLAAATASLPMFGATTQAVIDAFLGTTSEFDYLAFDATSLGADAMGLIVNMKGQAADVISFESRCYSASLYTTLVTRSALKSSALTNTSLTTQLALGSQGNIALKIDWGNTPDFDGLTSGCIITDIWWVSK
jgi:uncharacterized protein (UPF0261 family)